MNVHIHQHNHTPSKFTTIAQDLLCGKLSGLGGNPPPKKKKKKILIR